MIGEISILLLSLIAANPVETEHHLPSYILACSGKIQYLDANVDGDEKKYVKDCSADMMREIPPGVSLRVEDGTAVVIDSKGKILDLADKGELFFAEPLVGAEKKSLHFREILSSVFGHKRTTILKADDQQAFVRYPKLKFADGHGPALTSWEGIVLWDYAPPLPIALRAYSGDELIFGPEFLVEPIIELTELGAEGRGSVRLELMVIDSPYLPDKATLTLPLSKLLSLTGDPVPAVLVSELYIESATEGEETQRAMEEALAAGQPPLVVAAIIAGRGRLERAREVMGEEYGPNAPLTLQRGVSGIEIVGKLVVKEDPAGTKPCLDATTADELWECFWEYLGPAVVPEIPIADLELAEGLVGRLKAMEPEGWRPLLADAQIYLLKEDHRSTLAKIREARSLCQDDDGCLKALTVFHYLAVADRYSSFNRSVLVDAMNVPDSSI